MSQGDARLLHAWHKLLVDGKEHCLCCLSGDSPREDCMAHLALQQVQTYMNLIPSTDAQGGQPLNSGT